MTQKVIPSGIRSDAHQQFAGIMVRQVEDKMLLKSNSKPKRSSAFCIGIWRAMYEEEWSFDLRKS